MSTTVFPKPSGRIDFEKADKVVNAVSGNLAGLDANGNLTDSGKKPSDFATLDVSGKVPSSQLPIIVSNSLTDTSVTNALSAAQGKALNDKIVNILAALGLVYHNNGLYVNPDQ